MRKSTIPVALTLSALLLWPSGKVTPPRVSSVSIASVVGLPATLPTASPATLPATSPTATPASAPTVQYGQTDGRHRLAIFYGEMPKVNGAKSLDEAARFMAQYDYIIAGKPGEMAKRIRSLNPDTIFFSYIDLGNLTSHTLEEIRLLVDSHKKGGANGIFLDCAGYDFESSRERLNTVLDYVHSQGLKACVNAWHPEDVMGDAYDARYNPNRIPTRMGPNDYFLLEDFLRIDDVVLHKNRLQDIKSKADKVVEYRRRLGVKLFAVSTIDFSQHTASEIQNRFGLLQAVSSVWSLDAYGLCGTVYSASGGSLDRLDMSRYDPEYSKGYSLTPVVQLAGQSGKADQSSTSSQNAPPSTLSRLDYPILVHNHKDAYYWWERPAFSIEPEWLSPRRIVND